MAEVKYYVVVDRKGTPTIIDVIRAAGGTYDHPAKFAKEVAEQRYGVGGEFGYRKDYRLAVEVVGKYR